VAEQDKKIAPYQQSSERMSVAAIFVITTSLLIITLIDVFDKAPWTIWRWVDRKITKER